MHYDSDEPLSVDVKLEGRSNWEDWNYALKRTLDMKRVKALDHIDPRGRDHVRGRPLVGTPAPENIITAATGHCPAILQEGTTDSALRNKWDLEDYIGLELLMQSVKYEWIQSFRLRNAAGKQSLFKAYWTLYEEYGVIHPRDTIRDLRAFNNFSFIDTKPLMPQMDKLTLLYGRLRAAGIDLGTNHLALQYLEALPPSFEDLRVKLIVGMTNIANIDHTEIRRRILYYESGSKGLANATRNRSKGPRGKGGRRR